MPKHALILHTGVFCYHTTHLKKNTAIPNLICRREIHFYCGETVVICVSECSMHLTAKGCTNPLFQLCKDTRATTKLRKGELSN